MDAATDRSDNTRVKIEVSSSKNSSSLIPANTPARIIIIILMAMFVYFMNSRLLRRAFLRGSLGGLLIFFDALDNTSHLTASRETCTWFNMKFIRADFTFKVAGCFKR